MSIRLAAPCSIVPVNSDVRAHLQRIRNGSSVVNMSNSVVKLAASRPGCFVEGTLVHTPEGLRPIEKVQVGDCVLTRPLSGVGAAQYARVTRTFRASAREVFFLGYSRRTAGPNSPWEAEYLVLTGCQPIWVRNRFDSAHAESEPVNGWRTVQQLWDEAHESLTCEEMPAWAEVELSGGTTAFVEFMYPLVQAAHPDVGVVCTGDDSWQESWTGIAVRLEQTGPLVQIGSSGSYTTMLMNVEQRHWSEWSEADETSTIFRSRGFEPMRRSVYELEIADHHSFYVGAWGVLVRHAPAADASGTASTSVPNEP